MGAAKLLVALGPLCFFSCLGALVRIILSEFSSSRRTHSFQDGSALNPVLLPNTVGCFVMGVIQHPSCKPWLLRVIGSDMHTGISTGFAGSLTSFSSWIGYSVSLLFIFYPSVPPVFEVLWCLFIGWTTSYLAFFGGYHLMEGWNSLFPFAEKEPTSLNQNMYKIGIAVTWISYLLLTAGGIVIIFLLFSYRMLALAILFAPFGTFIRYYTSQYNKNFTKFPLMTFAVNIIGCIIFQSLAVTLEATTGTNNYDLLISSDTPAEQIYIPAVLLGFCGCLTTVSTFVNETRSLALPYNYFYAYGTFAVSFVMATIINSIGKLAV